MKATLKIGLIGCGRVAKSFHLPLLASLDGARLAAIADSDEQALTQARRMAPSVQQYTSITALLQSADIDAVVICLPTFMHAETAAQAFVAGKHVYLEKPLASSIQEARPAIAAWRDSGKVGMVGFNFRFHAAFAKLREQIAAGRAGPLVGGRSTNTSLRRELPEWKKSRPAGGGILLDLGSHHFDLWPFFLQSEITEVMANVDSRHTAQDTAMVQLRFSSGCIAQSFFAAGTVEMNSFELFGEKGRLSADRVLHDEPAFEPADMAGFRKRLLLNAANGLRPASFLRAPGKEPSFRLALEAFVQACRTGVAVGPDLMAGLRSLAVVTAAEQSAEAGRAIDPASLLAEIKMDDRTDDAYSPTA